MFFFNTVLDIIILGFKITIARLLLTNQRVRNIVWFLIAVEICINLYEHLMDYLYSYDASPYEISLEL